MDAQLLKGLNLHQIDAVTSPATVLQVLAPPGSGKTKTLTSRVAYLVAREGLNPQNVICCTFTVKASREMRERLRELVGCQLEAKLVLGTFHSICRRYLVAYGNLIGIPKSFGIADSSDSMSIVKRIVKRLKLSIDAKSARARISHHKAKGRGLKDLLKTPPKQLDKQEFVTVFQQYEEALATSQLLDYDDLLLRCVDLLRTHPGCVSNVEALLIDEFQDTNIVQFELMKLLSSAQRRVTIVGDPDQSIYGFRSAEIENLRRMQSFYPETMVINLEENYRSTAAILKVAQKVIDQDKNRPQKTLRATHCYGTLPVLRRLPNPSEEALWITSEIKRMTAMTGGLLRHSDFAILLRSAYLSLLIEKAFANSGIPYRMVGGQRFFDRIEIRIIIDYLRTFSHPDNNQALLAIINVPSRKIGDTTIAELLKLGEARNLSLWAVVQKVLSGNLSSEKRLSKQAEQELGRLATLIKNARHKVDTLLPATVPSRLIDFVVKSLDIENYLKKRYKDDHEDRLENVKELMTHASEVLLQPTNEDQLAQIDGLEQQTSDGGQEVLAQFLANIVLSTDVDKTEQGQDKPRVTISTIHSAKGLEWPAVFIPALYEGSIPHSRSEDTDEERRLLYVAMTRAQALLTMTIPMVQSRDQAESTLSQFLPSTIHYGLTNIGPLLDDRTIQDIATILRRPCPSQADLVRSLENMSGAESQVDNVWPSDGSRRPNAMFPPETGAMPEFGKPLAEVLAARQKQRNWKYSGLGTTTDHGSVPTMSNVNAFSSSTASLGFTTAGHQLRTTSALTRASSDTQPQQKKPKISRSASAQGSIASFFPKPVSQPLSFAGPDIPLRDVEPHRQRRQTPELPHPPLSLPHQVNPRNGIPEELASHKLAFGNAIFRKRPAPLSEARLNSRNRYRTLYSSSPPAADMKDEEKLATADIIRQSAAQGKPPTRAPILEPVNPAPESAPLRDYIPTRPATTMHKTTMSSIGRNGSTPGSLNHSIGRKTLGVRRTMSGWDGRKNK